MQHKNNTLLHLSLIPGVGPALIEALMRNVAALENIYALSRTELVEAFSISPLAAQKVADGLKDVKLLAEELALLEKYRITWLTIADQTYPALLKEIHLPPTVLYVKGVLPPEEKALALVGSRAATAYGRRVVQRMVPSLVDSGWLMVSGGAQGIDTFVHQATVDAQGKTIAVLGSGLLRPYPASNKKLFEQIVANGGALVSAFPLLTDPLPGNFPARNRIISGLSRGTLVVQAAQKSGALITARYALEQGREVFAVPGAIDDELSAGCHDLITQGATLATDAATIVQAFGETMALPAHGVTTSNMPKREHGQTHVQEKIEFKPATVTDLIVQSCSSPCSLDELLAITNLTMAELHTLLFDLQLGQKISQTMAGLWHAL